MLVKIIRETRPRVIVTWDPSGGYGHPDHIAAHKHATAAHYAASDANRFPSAGPAFKPEALYWLSFPMGEFARLAKELRDRGLPSFEAPGGDEALAQMELERYEPNAVLDVRPQYRQKVEALGTHRTQMGPDDIFMTMPDDLRSQFFAREYFYRVDPPLPEGVELEDLFASL
jgi:LmbE family N-acetylglucosaminyl deacetylase